VRGHRGLPSSWPCWLGRTLGNAVVGLAGPGQPMSPLPLHRGSSPPPLCLGAAVAVVPHRAALASPSRHRLAGGCPGLAGTAPRGLGGQWASACCHVGGNSPPLLHLPSQLPRPELGDLAAPCFVSSAITAMDPLSSPTLSVPSRVDSS
jgi:hypothetical protein